MKFLAADLGASSGRTIVGQMADGRITLHETHRFANAMTDVGGERHWDADRLIGEIRRGIAASGAVDGIGIDTWGVDYGLIDADGQLLDRPFAYRDARNAAAMPDVYRRLSKARLYEITGMQEMPFNTVFQLMADHINRPELLSKAQRMLMMPDLFTYMLTGRMTAEYSICSTTGMLDARTRSWSEEIIAALDLPRHIFGAVAAPGTRVGECDGTPVYLAPSHDTGSAVAAVPAVEGSWAFLSSGTWSLIGAELDQPILTEAALQADFTNEGGIDGTIRFLKNVNGLWLIQECRRRWAEQGRKLSFAEIAAAAEEETAFASVVDPNDPRLMAPENMLATIGDICLETGQPAPRTVGEYARCCYASLAKAYGHELDTLSAITGRTFDRLHVVGGGTQAELLNQLTADSCGMPVYAGPVEATALGNIAVQALANGVLRDRAHVRETVANSFPVTVYQPRT